MAAVTDIADRPVKETICLFDVDGTLTPARLAASPEMLETLNKLRQKCVIGFVSRNSCRARQYPSIVQLHQYRSS